VDKSFFYLTLWTDTQITKTWQHSFFKQFLTGKKNKKSLKKNTYLFKKTIYLKNKTIKNKRKHKRLQNANNQKNNTP